MVLRHASERFRNAYEIPIEKDDLFGAFEQFVNLTTNKLDESSYRSDLLAKYDLWRKKQSNKNHDELIDYQNLDESFYDNAIDENEDTDYSDDENSELEPIYQWHRDRHFDVGNSITRFIDDKA